MNVNAYLIHEYFEVN